jgi:hypothetical protein
MAWLDQRREDMSDRTSELNRVAQIRIMEDPEAMFQEAWILCDTGEHERGLARLQRAVAGGFYAPATLESHAAFDALRVDARFRALLAEAEAGRQRALDAFRGAGGERLLGRQVR